MIRAHTHTYTQWAWYQARLTLVVVKHVVQILVCFISKIWLWYHHRDEFARIINIKIKWRKYKTNKRTNGKLINYIQKTYQVATSRENPCKQSHSQKTAGWSSLLLANLEKMTGMCRVFVHFVWVTLFGLVRWPFKLLFKSWLASYWKSVDNYGTDATCVSELPHNNLKVLK